MATRRRAAGEGGVSAYSTKAGERYAIRYWAPAADGLAQQRVMRRGFKTRRAASDELRRVLAEVDKGGYTEPSKLTLGAYLESEYLPSVRLKPSTESSYRKNIRLHVIPYIGDISLKALTGQRLTALYRKLEAEGRADGAGGLSARTVRYVHTIIRKALAEAVEHGLIAVNPADKAKPPTTKQAKSPEMKYWTSVRRADDSDQSPTQLDTFLTWSRRDEDDLYVAWLILSGTGMRRGELLALRWQDVDSTAGTLAIRRSATLIKDFGEGERILVGLPKNDKPRVIDIDPDTVAALRAHRASLAGIDLQLARDEALVIPGRDGGIRHPERFSRTFGYRLARCRKMLGKDAPPVIRLHDLRHTHATGLLILGVHPKVVQERLGHATITITLDLYSHVLPSLQRSAADSWGAARRGA